MPGISALRGVCEEGSLGHQPRGLAPSLCRSPGPEGLAGGVSQSTVTCSTGQSVQIKRGTKDDFK